MLISTCLYICLHRTRNSFDFTFFFFFNKVLASLKYIFKSCLKKKYMFQRKPRECRSEYGAHGRVDAFAAKNNFN